MTIHPLLTRCLLFVCSLGMIVGCQSLTHGCITPSTTTQATKQLAVAQSPIKMGCSYDWAGWWPWAVAQEQHLFEANAIGVDLLWFDDYYAAINAMAEGELDANCQVFNDTVEQADRSVKGEVIILATDYSDGNDKLVATERIETVSDLAGKRVGAERGKLTDFLLTMALEQAGLSRRDVEIRDLNTTGAAIAFVAGQLDAVVAWQPDWRTALRRPNSHELLNSGDIPGAIPQVIAVSQELIDHDPDRVQGLVNTWFDTLSFINTHPDQTREILFRRSRLSEEEFELFSEGVHLLSAEENKTAFDPGEGFEQLGFTAQKAGMFLVDAGLIDQSPEGDELLDGQFVRAYGSSGT